MNKFLKILVWIVLLLLLAIGILYIYALNDPFLSKLEHKLPKPRLEIPVTYNIDWWVAQETIEVEHFKVSIEDCKLNLFNPKSLISYQISGHMSYHGHWQPHVNMVHISERMNRDTTLDYDRIIEITPLVKLTKSKNNDGGRDEFSFRNEHIIISDRWGANRIKFVCGRRAQIIELFQRK
jgi:hypothetical protein